jgi:8-oxo-dGTP diphosphatase
MQTPQFGTPDPDLSYVDRPAVFGLVEQGGRIALVRIQKPLALPWLDLPGGGIDLGESEEEALAREFGEETGLVISPGEVFARADQRYINTDGEAYNNRGSFWTAVLEGEEPVLKIEDDHELVWLPPQEALVRLRHDAHAWAVAAWLRARG